MQINIKSDIKRVARGLDQVQKKQIPFAASKAINDTLFEVRDDEQQAIGRYIDRPTPFTKKGFRVNKATKRKLVGEVEIPPNRWRYMRFAVAGGAAAGTSNVPVNATLNAYGSMRRNYLAGRLRRKNTFSGTVRGVPGIWERTKAGGVRLIAAYENAVHYKPIFPFHQIGVRTIKRRFTGNMKSAMRRALATAR